VLDQLHTQVGHAVELYDVGVADRRHDFRLIAWELDFRLFKFFMVTLTV
jgi:hypothetical protein